ncbi:MAG: pyridoxal phosphate-dependent decarboxylase family protein [Terriglobales bacterium]
MEPPDREVRPALEAAYRAALGYLDQLDRTSVAATVDYGTLRQRLDKPLGDEGTAPEQVVAELAADVEGGLLGSAGGRFFAWVIGGTLPAALAADWLTATWDQNAGLYACAPAAAVVEEVAGKWLKEIFGLPQQASFALVTGCQMAHATCLAAARYALLARRGWDVGGQGLFGAPPIRLVTSKAQHSSFERAVRLLGLGEAQIIALPTDAQDRLQAATLEGELAKAPDAPTLVLLQAGDVNIGAFDPFLELIPIAKRYGAWVHVDGAFGLWAAASPQYRHLLRGVQAADSWAADGHKWLNVPYDCGYAFVAEAEAHRAAMAQQAAYLAHDASARDEMDWNPEFSRRARGFPTYAALRQLGRHGVAALVERCCAHAHALATRIGALPSAELLAEPTINQGLVRFIDRRAGAADEAHDRRTNAVIAAIAATGEVFFSGTTWHGRRAMRISVSNWRTTERDVERSVEAVTAVVQGKH